MTDTNVQKRRRKRRKKRRAPEGTRATLGWDGDDDVPPIRVIKPGKDSEVQVTEKWENEMALRPGRAEEILLEETVEKLPRTRDRYAEEKKFRKVLRRQVRGLKKARIEVVIPAEIEVPIF